MGALTIKVFAFETRAWELQKVIFPNVFSTFPENLILLLKNNLIKKIYAWNRNDFISDKLRFNVSLFSSLLQNRFTFINKNFSFINNYNSIKNILSYTSHRPMIYENYQLTYNFKKNTYYVFDGYAHFPFYFQRLLSNTIKISNNLFMESIHLIDISLAKFCFLETDNFFFFDKKIKVDFPDLYYFITRSIFTYTEEENYEEEEVLIEKGNRVFFCNSSAYFNFIWTNFEKKNSEFFFPIFFSIQTLKSLLDVLNHYFPYKITKINDILGQYMVKTNIKLINSFGFIIDDLNSSKIR